MPVVTAALTTLGKELVGVQLWSRLPFDRERNEFVQVSIALVSLTVAVQTGEICK